MFGIRKDRFIKNRKRHEKRPPTRNDLFMEIISGFWQKIKYILFLIAFLVETLDADAQKFTLNVLQIVANLFSNLFSQFLTTRPDPLTAAAIVVVICAIIFYIAYRILARVFHV